MGSNSEDDTDMSDTEMEECQAQSYEELKSGKQQVKIWEEAYTCPFCPNKKRKRDYEYKDLLQHASGVGNSNSAKRSAKVKANHLALCKYLEKDLPSASTSSNSKPPVAAEAADERLHGCTHDEKLVWPWTGIVVNIPTRKEGMRFVGASGSKLRDEYIARGFNPTRVRPLWNFKGHSGTAIVEFKKDWAGLHNALTFEKAFEADGHGKRDWKVNSGVKTDDLYGWVARSDDYNGNDIVGENLRKIGNLKTVPEMIEEEEKKQHQLVSNLTNMIEVKNKCMKEIQDKCLETSDSLNKLMQENEKLHQTYNEELNKIQQSARGHFQRIVTEHEKLKQQVESQKKVLESRGAELEKREAHNEIERQKLSEELEENSTKNSSIQLASIEQERADENVRKLAEDQKRQKEELHKRIIELEKKLDMKQALELEIEQLRGKLNVMQHMVGDDDIEVLQNMETILSDLREKESDLEDLDRLNQTLIIKQRKSNDELQEARKELISALSENSTRDLIAVKRMGALDSKPFLEAMRRKYDEDEAEDRASMLCSMWEEYLKDPDWHPFKRIKIDGTDKEREVVNEEDEKLKGLKKELGIAAYNAVAASLIEINEYNPSGRYITSELWNYEKDTRATLKDGVEFLLNKLDTVKVRFT